MAIASSALGYFAVPRLTAHADHIFAGAPTTTPDSSLLMKYGEGAVVVGIHA